MSQNLEHQYFHLMFSTKRHEPVLDNAIREPLHAYMSSVFQGLESPVLIINSTKDHVHVLFDLSRDLTLNQVVEDVKGYSAAWLKAQSPAFKKFSWQTAFGAFSVSDTNLFAVRDYIANQRKHHKNLTFQGEFLTFLKRYGVPYDEEKVWD
jgi:putative transposase